MNFQKWELFSGSPGIPWYISTKEHSYFCGGVNYEEDAAKEKRRGRKLNVSFSFSFPSLRPLRRLRPRKGNYFFWVLTFCLLPSFIPSQIVYFLCWWYWFSSISFFFLFFILILNITNNNITFYHTKFLITILHYRDDTMGSEKIMTTPWPIKKTRNIKLTNSYTTI